MDKSAATLRHAAQACPTAFGMHNTSTPPEHLGVSRVACTGGRARADLGTVATGDSHAGPGNSAGTSLPAVPVNG